MGPRLVRGGKDDPAPDQYRLPFQRRVEELFDRSKERIQICMENGRLSHVPQYAGSVRQLIPGTEQLPMSLRPSRRGSTTRGETLQGATIDLAQMRLGKTVDEVDATGMLVGLEMGEGPIDQLSSVTSVATTKATGLARPAGSVIATTAHSLTAGWSRRTDSTSWGRNHLP